MPFESGKVSFRLFHYVEEMSDAVINTFASPHFMAPEIETVSSSAVQGWIAWRHLLDRELTPDVCYFFPWFHVTYATYERKIPERYLHALCCIECEKQRIELGYEKITNQLKSDVRDKLIRQYAPDMPPSLSGISIVVNFSRNLVYSAATQTAACEALAKHFTATTNRELKKYNPAEAALLRKNINEKDLQFSNFSDDENAASKENCNLGREFLTWLWFNWENNGDEFQSRIGERCHYSLEGPISFFYEGGKGACNVVCSKGSPLQSKESGIALHCGKKVKKVKLSLTDGSREWKVTVDDDFVFSGLKLPKEESDASPSFQERMEVIEKFVSTFFDLYDHFLEKRVNHDAWNDIVLQMRNWVYQRTGIENVEVSPEA